MKLLQYQLYLLHFLSFSQRAIAFFLELNLPPSKKESGVILRIPIMMGFSLDFINIFLNFFISVRILSLNL